MTLSHPSRRSRFPGSWRAILLFLLLPGAVGAARGQEPPRTTPPPPAAAGLPEELAEVERIEAVTESFADALNELADRLTAGDWNGTRRFFEEQVQGRSFPRPGPTTPEIKTPELKWLRQRSWKSPESRLRTLPRDQLLEDLRAVLAELATVERVSFEVTGSTLRAADLAATVALDARGRNGQGQREWVQGEAKVSARQGDDGAWRISSLVIDPLRSLIAERDLFHDATTPAGLAVASDLDLDGGAGWYPNGAAAVDVDQDGLLDLFVTGPTENHLYLNRGDGTFKDGAAVAGLKTILPGKTELNPVFFDFDNDGDSDLFITSVHENVLLENRLVPDGRMFFRNTSLGLPQNPDVQGWSVAVGDVNRDGLPDLYIPSYFSPLKGPFPPGTVDDTTGGRPSLLLLNQGGGSFKEEAKAWGVEGGRFAVSAQFADFDGDHDLDLYVANDFGMGNFLYINEGGRFVDQAKERGALHAAESMGVSFADYDNDGDLDLHVTNMSSAAAMRTLSRLGGSLRQSELLTRQWNGNALLQNQGDGTFRDVSAQAGPFPADWAWGGGFIDLDNDGWEDLHTPNGFMTSANRQDLRSAFFTRIITAMQVEDRETTLRLIEEGQKKMRTGMGKGYSFAGWTSDRAWLNRSDGRFLDISGVAGADSFPSDARATVYADFDNDGDLDVFVRATHGRSHFLFRNEVGQDQGFLRVALEGRASGRDAFGAVVRVKTPALTLMKSKHGNNGHLDQSDPRLLFGLGTSPVAEWIEVRWPSGLVQRLPGPFPAGSSLLLVEGEETPRPVAEKRFRLAGQETGKTEGSE